MANKIAQLSETNIKELIDLALQDVLEDSHKITLWVLDRSPKWRSDGYEKTKTAVEEFLAGQ